MGRVAAIVLVILALIGVLLWSQTRTPPLVVSGFVESDEIRLGSRVGGRVQSVSVVDGDEVKRGRKLVELEPFDLNEKLAQAEALWKQQKSVHAKLMDGFRKEERAQAEARVRQLEAVALKLKNGPRPQEIAVARADLDLAKAQQELATIEFDRAKALQVQDAATRQRVDATRTELRVSEDQVHSRSEQLKLLEAGTRDEEIAASIAQLEEARAALELIVNGTRQEDIDAAYAAMVSAEAGMNAIRKQIDELTIVAPVNGSVEAVELQPGDLVAPNAPVMTLLDHSRMWIRAFVPENRLNLKIGQKLKVTVDSFPGETFTAEVGFVSRQAEFTPGNVQTPEERSKQVFRIKAFLHDESGRLRPGMAADLWLEAAP